MASETITRNDLTEILNAVLPFSFTEFRHHTGTATIPKSTLVQVHSETFESGSWLILTSLEVTSGGAVSTTGQNRILENGALVYAHKDIADNSLNNVNYYVLESASNTTITLEAFQATNNSQTQEWRFTAIRIGDKFSQAEADYIVEEGTSGIWTYRKWNSGMAELWASPSQTVSAYATNAFVIGSATVTPYPFAITNPKAQAYCLRLGSGLGVISYDYVRTDYWSAVCCGVNQSIAQGQSRAIVWDLYIMARWK